MSRLSTRVTLSTEDVSIHLTDNGTNTIELFAGLSESQREQLCEDAWTIGLRAISNAYTSAQESRLSDIGKELMTGLEETMSAQIQTQQKRVDEALHTFFDPEDGKVHERLKHFIDDKGVLEQKLNEYLEPERGHIASALARQVGENSPLFKLLSPTESEGLVKQLEKQLERVMSERQRELDKALDPAHEGSPIARFLSKLNEDLKGSSTALDEQLKKALSALDGNDKNSLISNLARDTRNAQEAVLKAMNPEAVDSPLALLGASLKKSIDELSKSQSTLLEEQRERQKTFESDVKQSLERIEHRRKSDAKTTVGGFEFEEEVALQAEAVTQGMAVTVARTGNSSGATGQRKVGDVVIAFTEESSFHGHSIVIEAKRAANYTVDKALSEIEQARRNREASIGVFVMSSAHAHDNFPVLSRVGNDVLVQWDMEDPATDPNLRAAYMLALGLAARTKKRVDPGKIDALADIEDRLTKEINRLGKTRGFNEAIKKNADKIDNELRVAVKMLEKLLDKSKSTLQALGVDAVPIDLKDEEPVSFAQIDSHTAIAAESGSTAPEATHANSPAEFTYGSKNEQIVESPQNLNSPATEDAANDASGSEGSSQPTPSGLSGLAGRNIR